MVDPVADTRFLNQFFAGQAKVTVRTPFVFEVAAARHHGTIAVHTAKGEVELTVYIPESYPQGEALFYPKVIDGYPHQNVAVLPKHGGTLCLSTPFVDHLPTRLELEMQQLHGWLQRYYVREEADPHYEYIPVPRPKGLHLLYDEEAADDTPARFAQQQSGTFTYDAVRPADATSALGVAAPAYLCSGLGHLAARWAPDHPTGRFTGAWVLLNGEPVVERKQRVNCWRDLLPLLPDDFYALLRRLGLDPHFRRQSPSVLGNRFAVAVGYRIPSASGYEITWDVLLLPLALLRRDASSIQVQNRLDALDTQRLVWGQTSNASYSRFFGRGQLPDSLTSSRVLILGVGALGSCVAETLVRGGVRHVSVADSDAVAPGNACRSRYRFRDIDAVKTRALKQHLLALSPFVSVQVQDGLTAALPGSQQWPTVVQGLAQHELIIDCSANNQVLTTLRHAAADTPVVHLSITEGAEELIAVSGPGVYPLHERREQLLAHLQRSAYPEFREGTGCWHPTFRASGAAIESLVGLAITELADMARQKRPFRTFSLHRAPGRGICVNVDQHYAQPAAELQLIITSECLDQIEQHTLRHYPKEFGGVLVGNYSADGRCAIVSRVLVPTRYKNSLTSFAPDPACINRQLCNLPAQLQYLGDWHSHPDGPAQPSPTDKATMAKLAAHPAVRTSSPLLLIAQTHRHQIRPQVFVQHHGQLLPFSPTSL